MASDARRAQWRDAQRRAKLRRRGELPPFRPMSDDLYAVGVKVTSEDGGWCLEWPRAKLAKGYGRVWWGGYPEIVSRASLELKLGRPLLPGMWALHTCDNPPCYRQEHLYEGTPQENTDDMTERQRAYWSAIRRSKVA